MRSKLETELLREATTFGVSEELFERLYALGHAPFIAWLTHRRCDHNPSGVTNALAALIGDDVEGWHIRYAYYDAKVTPIETLKQRPEYMNVLQTLCLMHPNLYTFWVDVMPYAYKLLKRFCVVALWAVGWKPRDIAATLGLSYEMVYKLIRRYKNENTKHN